MAARWITIAAAALAASGMAVTRAPAQERDAFQWSGVVAAGKTLEIRGVNGDIVVAAASGAAAEVRANKEGEDSDPRLVRIEVVQDAQGLLICAVYPSPRRDRPNTCRRGGGSHETRDNDVEVDFAVRVPRGVRLVASTVNGDVRASGVTADAVIATVNGDVEVRTTGTATAHTVNGSIDASMGSARWNGTLEFQTVNGSVTLSMPAGTGADVEGTTVNGSLDSDFPLMLEAEQAWGPQRFEGRIGAGGGRMKIDTVNGSIRLRRAG